MEGPSIGEIIAAGIVPDPHNRPVRVMFEYASGATLYLEDDLLIAWWREYCSALALIRQIKSVPEPYSMKSVRKAVNSEGPIPFRRPKKDEAEE